MRLLSRRTSPLGVCLLLGLSVSCGTKGTAEADAGTEMDAGPVNKAANCASTFGNELTNAFGRLDGTVTAIVSPSDMQCAKPNGTHVIVQVQMNGAVYRMVVNVVSNSGTPDVLETELDAPLPGGAWQEGWHPNQSLDYPSTLGVHSTAFTPYATNDLVKKIVDELPLGAPISVFATSSGGSYADSAHLVHRNGNMTDGAIVLNPNGTEAHFLLFRFSEQTF